MESDGRIRSKDIGTDQVNSRALDNIRSSNFNGSHIDPELDPGSAGWQILKSGFAVFNDAVFRGTVNAARIVSAIIESGVVRLTSGGKIELGGDPETGTPATATLSETGIVVGPTSLTASGVQVGTDVVMDSTGLWLDGGQSRALDFASDEAGSGGQTLTTTTGEKAFFTLAVPTWANSAACFCIATVQSTDGGFGPLGLTVSARIDGVNDGGAQADTAGLLQQATHVTEKVLTSFGSTIRLSIYAGRNGGSGNPTNAQCFVRGFIMFLR